MKKKRHEQILKLIENYSISTQDELLKRLRENGFEATQATVSRDIKELRLVKTMGSNSTY
ncbi:MAG: arginine repressor, partial [Clostridiales bacterium]|nr:arginine repressor [Clostridiales bacterium]